MTGVAIQQIAKPPRARRAPVVCKADLARGLKAMVELGFTPAMTFLPGGAVRLHPVARVDEPHPAVGTDFGAAEWDARTGAEPEA